MSKQMGYGQLKKWLIDNMSREQKMQFGLRPQMNHSVEKLREVYNAMQGEVMRGQEQGLEFNRANQQMVVGDDGQMQIDADQTLINMQNVIADILSKGNYAIVTKIDAQGNHKYVMVKSNFQLDELILDGRVGSSDMTMEASDFVGNTFVVTESIKNPLGFQKIMRSVHGMGQHLKQCEVVDNDLCYIPPSGQCLRDNVKYCFKNNLAKWNIIDQVFEQFYQMKEIFREDIARCNLKDLVDMLNKSGVKIDIGYCILKNGNWQAEYQKKQSFDIKRIVCRIYDNHWCLLKGPMKESHEYIQQNLRWRDKQLCDVIKPNDFILQEERKQPDGQRELFTDTYVWDLEAFRNAVDQFMQYACAIMNVNAMRAKLKVCQYKPQLVEQEIRKCVKMFDGQDSVLQMLDYIEKQHPRKDSYKKSKDGKMLKENKNKITVLSHNGANFDHFFVLKQSKYKFGSIVKKGGIMQLTVESENCKIKFIDSCKFVKSSLKKLCKSYNVPEYMCKTEIEHNEITKDNYIEMKNIWGPYLENDVMSLGYIWMQFSLKMYQITGYYSKSFISIASYAKACCDQVSGKQKAFKDPVMRKFVQRSIRGGMVQAKIQSFKNNVIRERGIDLNQYLNKQIDQELFQQIIDSDDGLIPFDATSQYPSAMQKDDYDYPDIESAFIMSWEQLEDLRLGESNIKAYFIEVDIYIPRDLKYVPISYKDADDNCQFRTGLIKNIVINAIDVIRFQPFEIKIIKVYQGIGFTKTMRTPYKKFVHKMFAERKKIKDQDPILGDLYKLILNSSYGKTCEREHEEEDDFTEAKNFEEKVYDDSVNDYQVLDNGQILFNKQSNSERVLSENHMASYILSSSKHIMDNFILKLNAHKENILYYMDTDSMYIHKKYLPRLGDVKDDLCGGKNDYQNAVIIEAYFLGPKQKICYVLVTDDQVDKESGEVIKAGTILKKVTFKGVQGEQMKTFDSVTAKKIIEGETLQVSHFTWKRDFKTAQITYKGKDQYVASSVDKNGKQNQDLKIVRNVAQNNKFQLNEVNYEYIHNEME